MHRGYRIPENVNLDNFLLLQTRSDSVEKVIDKLTLVLSSVQDDEMREVGYQQAERQRLLQAWELYVQFRYNISSSYPEFFGYGGGEAPPPRVG